MKKLLLLFVLLVLISAKKTKKHQVDTAGSTANGTFDEEAWIKINNKIQELIPWTVFNDLAYPLYDEQYQLQNENWLDNADEIIEKTFGMEQEMNKYQLIDKIVQENPKIFYHHIWQVMHKFIKDDQEVVSREVFRKMIKPQQIHRIGFLQGKVDGIWMIYNELYNYAQNLFSATNIPNTATPVGTTDKQPYPEENLPPTGTIMEPKKEELIPWKMYEDAAQPIWKLQDDVYQNNLLKESCDELTKNLFGTDDKINKWDLMNKMVEQNSKLEWYVMYQVIHQFVKYEEESVSIEQFCKIYGMIPIFYLGYLEGKVDSIWRVAEKLNEYHNPQIVEPLPPVDPIPTNYPTDPYYPNWFSTIMDNQIFYDISNELNVKYNDLYNEPNWEDQALEIIANLFGEKEMINKWDLINKIYENHPDTPWHHIWRVVQRYVKEQDEEVSRETFQQMIKPFQLSKQAYVSGKINSIWNMQYKLGNTEIPADAKYNSYLDLMPWFKFDDEANLLYPERDLVEQVNWHDQIDEAIEKIFGGEEKINKWDFIQRVQERHPQIQWDSIYQVINRYVAWDQEDISVHIFKKLFKPLQLYYLAFVDGQIDEIWDLRWKFQEKQNIIVNDPYQTTNPPKDPLNIFDGITTPAFDETIIYEKDNWFEKEDQIVKTIFHEHDKLEKCLFVDKVVKKYPFLDWNKVDQVMNSFVAATEDYVTPETFKKIILTIKVHSLEAQSMKQAYE